MADEERQEEVIEITGVRSGRPALSARDVKEFWASFSLEGESVGKSLLSLREGGIVIQYDDSTSIQLGSSGVEIMTDKDIEVIARERIELKSEKVVSIEAEEMIEVFGENSFVELSPTEIKMFAEDIEMDELLITEAEGIEAARDARLTIRLARSLDEDGIRGVHGDFIRYQQMRESENIEGSPIGCP